MVVWLLVFLAVVLLIAAVADHRVKAALRRRPPGPITATATRVAAASARAGGHHPRAGGHHRRAAPHGRPPAARVTAGEPGIRGLSGPSARPGHIAPAGSPTRLRRSTG
jgi:hypothetical protein